MRCYQCGTPLSNIKAAFDRMREIKTMSSESSETTHVEKRMVDATQNTTLEDVFKTLHLTRYCCRTHIMTAINFQDMEKN